MPSFGAESLKQLETCHAALQMLFNRVVKNVDCKITEGHRSLTRQAELFAANKSKTMKSKHLSNPSIAVDVVPYPVIWPDKKNRPDTYMKDLARFYAFAAYVKGVADSMGIKIRSGMDWDGDWDFTDQDFNDLPHFELMEV